MSAGYYKSYVRRHPHGPALYDVYSYVPSSDNADNANNADNATNADNAAVSGISDRGDSTSEESKDRGIDRGRGRDGDESERGRKECLERGMMHRWLDYIIGAIDSSLQHNKGFWGVEI